MRMSARLFQLGAVVPASAAGTFVALMTLGLLPGLGEMAVRVLGVVGLVALALGLCEGPAARVLGFARGLRPGERAALAPAIEMAHRAGFEVVRILVRRTDTGGLAWPIGRRTIIVEPYLVQGLHEHTVQVGDAGLSIAHAAAELRVGPARFDLAARWWALPWTLLWGLVRGIACGFRWVPAGGASWALRGLVGAAALAHGFGRGGTPAIGIGAAALVAVSYLAPAAERRWRYLVEDDVDILLVEHGLAVPLLRLLGRAEGGLTIERAHRIRAAAASARRLAATP